MKKAGKTKKTNGKGIQEILNFIVDRMTTKDDLKKFATKEDLKEFATKDDLKRFATKEDVREIVDEKLKPITDEMRSMRYDVKELKVSVDNLKELPKEIDCS